MRFGQTDSMPAIALNALRRAGTFDLLSIDPSVRQVPPHATDLNRIQGFLLLGQTPVLDARQREAIVASLVAAAENWDGLAAGCVFQPRHGIRIDFENSMIDILICFHCRVAKVFKAGIRVDGFQILPTPERLFDQLLKAADVPLAAKGCARSVS